MKTLREAYKFVSSLQRRYALDSAQDLALGLTAAHLIRLSKKDDLDSALKESSPPGLDLAWNALTRLLSSSPHCRAQIVETALLLTSRQLGLIYEASLRPDWLNRDGAFYTPGWLSDAVTSRALSYTTARSILDPACGGGGFLLSAFEALIGKGDRQITEVLESIFGVDRDTTAVTICRATILSAVLLKCPNLDVSEASRILARQIISADSLFDNEQLTEEERLSLGQSHLVSWRSTFPPMRSGGFDLVLGNPPYGLSRDQQITAAEKQLLERSYSEWRSGKMNKYLLFIARGFELLRDGGVLAYVVPNSWLGISSARAVRKRLVSSGSLCEIHGYSGRVFDTPGVEVVTLVASKNAGRQEFLLFNAAPNTTSNSTPSAVPYSSIRPEDDWIIPLRWEPKIREFLDIVRANSIRLGSGDSPFIPLIALQAYAKGKGTPPQTAMTVKERPFDRSAKDAPDVYPYYKGGDIERYRLGQATTFLKYGPWLAEPQKLSRFTGPRLIIREILGAPPYRVRATYLEESALYNKSILHILPKEHVSPKTVLALLGIINSRLGSIIFHETGRKTQRTLFPKLLNADLKGFLIPKDLDTRGEHLARLVSKRLIAEPENTATLDEEIEDAVLTLFGIKSDPIIMNFQPFQ